MFEITHQQLRDSNFVSGMRKVLDHPCTDIKKSYNLGRMGTQLTNVQKEADDVFKKLVRAHGTTSENGTFEIPDDKLDGWKIAQEEFMGHSIKVERHKIRADDVEGIPLTPAEVAAMDPVLEGFED